MTYTVADLDELEPGGPGGMVRLVRKALGTRAFGCNYFTLPPGQEGREHDHEESGQEEVYFVVRGRITFKIGADVFEAGPETAVRIAPGALRSIHNDTSEEAEVILCSVRVEDLEGEVETEDGFWPG